VGVWVFGGLRVGLGGWLFTRMGWLRGLSCCLCMVIRTMRPFGMGWWRSLRGGSGSFGMTFGGVGGRMLLLGGRGIGWRSWWTT
jgi:hypothetical protein